jgi:hypothetical protein
MLLAIFIFIVLILIQSFAPSYVGIYGIVLSVIGIASGRSLLTVLLSFLNFSVSIAFDYYLRVWDYGYEFYDGRGISIEYLSFVSVCLFVYVLSLDWRYINPSLGKKYIVVPSVVYQSHSKMYYPLLLLVIWCAGFVFSRAGSMFSSTFSLDELQKYSFLEYFSVIIFFLLRAVVSDFRRNVALFFCSLLVVVMLLASYRMVSIIYFLTIIIAIAPGFKINRSYAIFAWLAFYVSFAFIGYIRGDGSSLSFSTLLGYKDYGYLDNTFTGVIETALIYSSIYEVNTLAVRIGEFIGTMLPVPGFLIPDNMIYYYDLESKYDGRIPGGGLLAGFVIYYDFLLLPVLLGYLLIAYKAYSNPVQSIWLTSFGFVALVSVSRWWLYGPYVLFKFLGVFLLFYVIDYALKRVSIN